MTPMPRGAATDSTLSDAIRDVFGTGRAIVAWTCIVAGGAAGWVLSGLLSRSAEAPREWLRPWACVGYGIALGASVAILPLAWRIMQLGATVSRRPSPEAASDPARTWWPLRLVAAALRNTPVLRMTAQDFTAATGWFAAEARGLISHRLWPACAAAFAAPVFGLVSAWLSWGRSIDSAATRPVDAIAVPLGDVAWPMAFTILAGCVVMLGVVLVDQMTRGLLQRWSTIVIPQDVETAAVQARLADVVWTDQAAPSPTSVQETPPAAAMPAAPTPVAQSAAAPPVTPVDLKGLEDMFRNG
jgi:hypothetical protein